MIKADLDVEIQKKLLLELNIKCSYQKIYELLEELEVNIINHMQKTNEIIEHMKKNRFIKR